jgi:hypothetical protein
MNRMLLFTYQFKPSVTLVTGSKGDNVVGVPRRERQMIFDADQRAQRLIHVQLAAASSQHAGMSSTFIEEGPSGAADY